MADLLFAASAAEDDAAADVLAQTQRRGAPRQDRSDFETVDDMEVAALAAASAQWSAELPLSQLPSHTDRDLVQEAMDCSTDSENEYCSSTSSDSEALEAAFGGSVAVSLTLEPLSEDDADPDAMQTSDVRVRVELRVAEEVQTEAAVVDDAMEVCEDEEKLPEAAVKLEVTLEEGDRLQIVGAVRSRVGQQLVIQAESLVRPLDTGSILFTLEGLAVGTVVEIFGSVEAPLYLLDAVAGAESETETKVYSTERLSSYLEFPTQEAQVTSESEEERDEAQLPPREPPAFRARRSAGQRRRRAPRVPLHHNQGHVPSGPSVPPMSPVYYPQWPLPPVAGPSFYPQPPYFSYSPFSPTGVAFPGFHPYTALPQSDFPGSSETSHQPRGV